VRADRCAVVADAGDKQVIFNPTFVFELMGEGREGDWISLSFDIDPMRFGVLNEDTTPASLIDSACWRRFRFVLVLLESSSGTSSAFRLFVVAHERLSPR
jgi:hypothetical protein